MFITSSFLSYLLLLPFKMFPLFTDNCSSAFIEEIHHFRISGNELVSFTQVLMEAILPL